MNAAIRYCFVTCVLAAVLVMAFCAGCGGATTLDDQLAVAKSTMKKPIKPPPEPPEPADPAIAYSINGSELMVMDADGASQTSVGAPYGARSPSWSPEGSRLAFATAGSDFTICTINVDGSDLVEVTQGVWLPGSPAWSPVPVVIEEFGTASVEVLAYKDTYGTTYEEVQSEIYLVPADGSCAPVNLTNTRYISEGYPTWSPDGTKLAYRWSDYSAEVTEYGILVYDFVTGNATEIAGAGPLHAVLVQDLNWAKTQDSIALCAYTAESVYEIWVIHLSDPLSPVKLTDDPSMSFKSPSWSPDDSEIVYCAGVNIWKMDADGTANVMLAKPPRKKQSLSGTDWRRNP